MGAISVYLADDSALIRAGVEAERDVGKLPCGVPDLKAKNEAIRKLSNITYEYALHRQSD